MIAPPEAERARGGEGEDEVERGGEVVGVVFVSILRGAFLRCFIASAASGGDEV